MKLLPAKEPIPDPNHIIQMKVVDQEISEMILMLTSNP